MLFMRKKNRAEVVAFLTIAAPQAIACFLDTKNRQCMEQSL